ncbi:MAG: hypothetical protein AB7H97_11225 [Pseudobdellovibrionaceae bacterium]
MAFFIGWIIGCIIVGALASNWKGRDPWGWGIMAAFFTPVLMLVILAVVSDVKAEEAQVISCNTFNFEKFKESLSGIKSLHAKGIYDDVEYKKRHDEVVNSINGKILTDTVENNLIRLCHLVDESLLTKEELQKIKLVIEKSYQNDQSVAC